MRALRATGALACALVATGCTTSVAGTASPGGAAEAQQEMTPDSTQIADYAAGQEHVRTDVDYGEDPPVGGPHDGVWADCTGTVYDVAIRPENAVHSLEHGAVWVTYDPDLAGDDDVAALTDLVEGGSYVLLSPYPGLGTVVSAQAWNHAIRLDDVADPRLEQFVALLAANPETTPEVGASCESPSFAADPETA